MKPSIAIPEFFSPYLVMTLNKMGPVSSYISPFTEEFIDFASRQSKPALEIGAAYGFVAQKALQQGIEYIANDIEPKHLQILYENTPLSLRHRLSLLSGKFPTQTNIPPESMSAAYLSRVLGYLSPDELRQALKQLFSSLEPGGKVFILASAAYLNDNKKLSKFYQERVKAGLLWPGYLKETRGIIPDHLAQLIPRSIHFLSETVLFRELKLAGFKEISTQRYQREEFAHLGLSKKIQGIKAKATKP